MKRIFTFLAVAALLALAFLFFHQENKTAESAAEPAVVPAGAHGRQPALAESEDADTAQLAPNSGNPSLVRQDVRWREMKREGVFATFHDWTQRYNTAANSEDKANLAAEGALLAQQRRAALAEMIRQDPEQALSQAVPFGVRRALPKEVTDHLEEPVSGTGQLALLAALPEPGKEAEAVANFRTATIGDRTFEAYVYGWRLGEPTRNRVPLHGIAIDEAMAVSANPVRLLEPDEAQTLKTNPEDVICSVSELPATVIKEEVAVQVGDDVTYLCRPDHAEVLNERLVAAESGGPDPELDPFNPEPSAYTEGQKKAIFIRVDFDDLQGVPVSDSTLTTILSNVNNFYSEMSYGRASFFLMGQGSDMTPTFRLTNAAAYYGTNNFYAKLRTDARAAATAAGYTLSNYQFDVICFGAVPGWTWGGLGYVGAPGSWVRNSFGSSGSVTAHELGHNFGLNHANHWDTGGQSIIGEGTSVEYGDSFDNMGAASSIPNGHYNARYKNYLDWLKSNEVQTVSSSGTYRIFTHDNASSTGIRGLKILKAGSTNYWVEFRQKFTSNKWLMSGVGLRWAQTGNQKSHLLDTTPGSVDGKNDACIVIGRTFSDKQANVHITPIGKGGTVPESLDVVINLGSFPTNVPPTITMNAPSTNASTGQTLSFTVAASDANGDALAYYWDFGDGNFGTNGPAASKSWSSTGEYLVRCDVTDMKGGVASDSVIVRVGSPTTYRISGQVTSGGLPVHGARVFVSTTRMTWTDSDGTYNLVGLPAGTYTIDVSLDGYVFAAENFSNPVSVGPNAVNVNFFDAQGAPFITEHPQSQTNFVGAMLTFTSSAVGAAPLRYQWQFNGASIAGATNANHVLASAQMTNAGNYRVIVTNSLGSVTSQVATLTIQNSAVIQTLFSDNFETNSGANWATNRSSTDTRVTFNYNYAGDGIPPAPNSAGGTTRGVKFEANMTNGVAAAISISPLGQNFTGDYRLRFDMWINANGPFPNGGTGSTEHLTAGVGTAGNRTQWTGSGTTADGFWFAVDGEGGAGDTSTTSDFNAYAGTTLQATTTGVYAAGTASNARGNTNTYYATTFPGGQSAPQTQRTAHPQQTGTLNVGTVGMAWRDVIINKTNNTVEWFIDGLKIATINNATFTANNIFIGYWDAFTSVSDNGAVSFGLVDNLRVERTIFTPVITSQPQHRTVNVGQNAAFSVSATGTTLAYQWRFNGTNLAGATASSYTRTNAQLDHSGVYSVIVSNLAGTVFSQNASLTVLQPPLITTQPVSQSVNAGDSVLFTVEAEGSEPMTFQWRHNGTNVSGANTALLALSQVQPSDAGNYTVVVSNAAGNVTSALATLTVTAPPMVIGNQGAGFASGQFGFSVAGPQGQVVVVEGSENLQSWTALQTNTLGPDPWAFSDPQSASQTNRYYRLRMDNP